MNAVFTAATVLAVLPVLAVLAVLAVAVAVAVAIRRRMRRRREGFLPALLGIGVTGLGIGAPVIIDKIKNKKYKPTFVGRERDEFGWWSCPAGTVDTGRKDHEACVSSSHMHPLWRWCEDDKKWDHCCPQGTVPAPEKEWEKKCLVGYQKRVLMNGSYVCPPGTEDTGANWGKSGNWHEDQKQCKRTGPYTLRMWDGSKWTCPPGTRDTGKTWGQPGERMQCLFCEGDGCK